MLYSPALRRLKAASATPPTPDERLARIHEEWGSTLKALADSDGKPQVNATPGEIAK